VGTAAMSFRDGTYDRQAEACPALVSAGRHEAPKQLLSNVPRNRAGAPHAERDRVAGSSNRDVHRSRRLGVNEGVVDQVRYRASQPQLVTAHPNVAICRERDARAFFAERFERTARELGEINWREALRASCFDVCQAEELAQQSFDAFARFTDALHEVTRLRWLFQGAFL